MQHTTKYRYRDLVYLIAHGNVAMAKSTLDLGTGIQVFCGETSPPLVRRRATAVVGTTQCAFAMRTITEHGKCFEREEEAAALRTHRQLATNLEAMFVWEDEEATTCAAWMFTLPPNAVTMIGGQDEFVTQDGHMGDKSVALFRRLLETGLALI